eukprot:1143413-Pelagomonas_calceolata.AAC.2
MGSRSQFYRSETNVKGTYKRHSSWESACPNSGPGRALAGSTLVWLLLAALLVGRTRCECQH